MSLLHKTGNESCVFSPTALSNNGMHPTANSGTFIENLPLIRLNARRVMPGVMSPHRIESKKSPAAPPLNDTYVV